MKPEIIVHMHIAIDGKINGPHLKTDISDRSQREYYNLFLSDDRYYDKHRGWLCGTETSAVITKHQAPVLDESITEVPDGDFLADTDAKFFYFTLDPDGKLGWSKNYYTYFETSPHIVEIITEKTSPAFKAYLRDLNISYIIAGKEKVDLALAIEKISNLFDMDQLMVNGGGGINRSFLTENLVDEVSLVVTPIADGDRDSQSLFYFNPKYNEPQSIAFNLEQADKLQDGSLWLRYSIVD